MNSDPRKKLHDVIKSHDSWWTTQLPARAANRFVVILSKTNITPNQVTFASLLLALVAAVSLGSGIWIWMAVGAIILQVSFILDCVDGQLARFKRIFSLQGVWLDTTTDVIKLFAIYFGLTLGVVRSSGVSSHWGWGFLAFFLSNTSMFLYYIRPDRLKAESAMHDESLVKDDTILEKIYRLIRKRAYFLSFSVPDQLLLISIGTIVGLPGLLLRVLVVWGTVAISFSLIRTWLRLNNSLSG